MKRRVSSVRNALGSPCSASWRDLLSRPSHRIEYYQVTSSSMEPTLLDGDRLIKSPARELARGDIVIFKKPDVARNRSSSGWWLWRAIAWSCATVKSMSMESARSAAGSSPAGPQPDRTWLLKPGQGFVAGDNREFSLDSRDYGRSIWIW